MALSNKGRVTKQRDSEKQWAWECCSTCWAGGKGYISQPQALQAFYRHITKHRMVGFR